MDTTEKTPDGIKLRTYKPLLSLSEASELSGMSSKTLRAAYMDGQLPGVRMNKNPRGKILLVTDALEVWLNETLAAG